MDEIALSMDEILVPDMIRRIATINQDYTIWQTLSQTSKNMGALLRGLGTSLAIPCYSGIFSKITGHEKILERKDMVPDKWSGINSLLERGWYQDSSTVMQYEFDDRAIKRAFCGRNTILSDGFWYDMAYEILFSDGIRASGYCNEDKTQWSHEETFFINFRKDDPITLVARIGKWSKQDFSHIIIFWMYQCENITLEVEIGSIRWLVGYNIEDKNLEKLKTRYFIRNRENWRESNLKTVAMLEHIEKSEFGNDVFFGLTKTIGKLRFPKLVLSRIKNMNDQNSKLVASILETPKIGF